MKYKLGTEEKEVKVSLLRTVKEVNTYIGGYGRTILTMVFVAFLFILLNSLINVFAPSVIGDATKELIAKGDKDSLAKVALGLLALYVGAGVASYFQILIMGRVGQNILARLRFVIFKKVQSLPLAFFNQNKSGDLISRINNDTDKINQALSEILLRFVGNIFVIIGIGIAMVILNPLLGILSLTVCLVLILITNLVSGVLKRLNRNALEANGNLSGEIQESLSNFKVIVAYNRRDYFKDAFNEVNEKSRKSNTLSGIANNILTPLYDFGGNFALFLVYFVGINLILYGTMRILGIDFKSSLEFGTLISYVLYIDRFYSPLRIMASLYSSLQVSLAAWSRISELLKLESDIKPLIEKEDAHEDSFIKFENVSFGYDPERLILKDVNLKMESGKTYALVGPTGGGKSTTASLIARLYDVTEGRIFFKGHDIKSHAPEFLSEKIGFILQEPFLFTGNLFDNIIYGNKKLENLTEDQLFEIIKAKGLEKVFERFPEGLQTKISNSTENISLGQKQLLSFLRIFLREPELLIMDEATANIDTVTEQLLEKIIDSLPKQTTKVIIAHRLNTIKSADQIFFINGGKISDPLSFNEAQKMINETKSNS